MNNSFLPVGSGNCTCLVKAIAPEALIKQRHEASRNQDVGFIPEGVPARAYMLGQTSVLARQADCNHQMQSQIKCAQNKTHSMG